MARRKRPRRPHWYRSSYRDFQSRGERMMACDLGMHGIKFYAQHPVRRPEWPMRRTRFMDFYLPEFKIDLEVDGRFHAMEPRMAEDDARDKLFIESGFCHMVLRVTNIEVETRQAIRRVLDLCGPKMPLDILLIDP